MLIYKDMLQFSFQTSFAMTMHVTSRNLHRILFDLKKLQHRRNCHKLKYCVINFILKITWIGGVKLIAIHITVMHLR